MKKNILILSLTATICVVAFGENVILGERALSESSSTTDSIAIGKLAGLGLKKSDGAIAIGKGALLGASDVNRSVAIGQYEMFGESFMSDTTSINQKQLWASKPLNAFCINPNKEAHITNTPLHYIGGEITLQADRIKLKSKNSLLKAKQWIDFNQTVISTTEITNYLGDGSIEVYVITNMAYIADIANNSLPPSYPFNLIITPVAHRYSLNTFFDYDKWIQKLIPLDGGAELWGDSIRIGPLRFAQGYSVANEDARLTIKEDYDAEVKMHFRFYPRDLDLECSYILPLSNALKDCPIEPILHTKPEPDSWNALISSSGVFEEFNRRLSGLSFDLEGDNRINVYYSGKKVGYITFTPEI